MDFDATPDQLSLFVREYLKHESQPDAAVIAITRAGLRNPMYPPSSLAEMYLARSDIQAAILAAKQFYKPKETKDISQQTLLDSLEVIASKAEDAQQFQPAISARKLQAELLGILKQTVEHKHSVTVKNVSDADLERIASKAIIDGEYTEVTPSKSKDVAVANKA